MSEEQSLPLLLTPLIGVPHHYIHVGDDVAAFKAQPEGLGFFLRPTSLSVAYVEKLHRAPSVRAAYRLLDRKNRLQQ